MLLIKPGVIPPPKRFLFKCDHCGCEWVASENELKTDERGYYDTKCPTCNKDMSLIGYEREVSPEEYEQLESQCEPIRYVTLPTSWDKVWKGRGY